MKIKNCLKILMFGALMIIAAVCVGQGGNNANNENKKSNAESSVVDKDKDKEKEKKKTEFTDPLKAIVVKKSKNKKVRCSKFSIALKSNPTTGYKWFLKSYDSSLIVPIMSKFHPSTEKKLVGASGYEQWDFCVKEAGFVVPQTTSITLIYARPWDEQGAQAINFKVVTDNAN